MRPRVGTTGVVVLGAMVLCAGAIEGQQGRVAPAEPASVLHERAKRASGRHLKEVLKEEGPAACASVAELAARSPVIVIGQALAQRGHLTQDQRISTDLVFKVQESVRGAVQPGSLITITRQGGSYRFKDGAIATLQRAGYRPARNQAQYLFFLKESGQRTMVRGAVAFEMAVGSQSQFELDFVNDRVLPAVGEPLHPLVTKYAGTGIRELLRELHAAVPRTR